MSDLPPPRQPYRSAAVFHAILAVVILVVAGISGGDAAKAVVVAVLYFVVATGWTWFRFHRRGAKASEHREGGEGV